MILNGSKRSLSWIPSRIKEFASAFTTGQGDREHLHKIKNLPTEEKVEYLRKQKVKTLMIQVF
jgi:hypothetical protein